MANKKKRKHKKPVAPRIHSAPGTISYPTHAATDAPPGRSDGAAPATSSPAETPRRTKQTPGQRLAARRRKARRRNWLIAAGVIVLLAGALIAQQVLGGRAAREFNALAEANGCSAVRETGDSGALEHLQPGETAKYDTSPPSHGKHAPTTLPSGVYDEPLSDNAGDDQNIYKSVHSLEHGAVIIWHDKLSSKEQDDLESEYRNENKVIVVPYPDLKGDTHVAMTAWGRMMTCEKPSDNVIDGFIDRFRGARSAPEPNNSI